jgi:membrane fusion protein, multidrug efflux system
MAGNGNLIKKRRFLIPVSFVLLCAALTVGYWALYLRGTVGTDDAAIDGDPLTLSSKIPGRIVEITVDEGDSVTAGRLLARLDDGDLRAQEAQGKAACELAQQSVSLAEVSLGKAKEDFERSSTQFKERIIPEEQYDHACRAYDLAQAQVKVSQAQVASAQAQLNVTQTMLRNTEIIAPAGGIVARKWVVPGDIVQPGQPILTIFDLRDLWITANLEETKLARIHPGDAVEISIDAFHGRKLGGKVELIGAAAASQFSLIPPNNASGNFTKVTQRVPVKIALSDTGGLRLIPGMSVEVKIKVQVQG